MYAKMVVAHIHDFASFTPKTHTVSEQKSVFGSKGVFYGKSLYAWRLRWCYWVNIHNYLDSRYEIQYIHLMKLCKCGSKRSTMFCNNNGVCVFVYVCVFFFFFFFRSLHMWCDKSGLVVLLLLTWIIFAIFEHCQNIPCDESKNFH